MTKTDYRDTFQTAKEIHDSIWGTISLTEKEIAILDHPIMQRLRRISQLGLVNMVYPSAGQTRLSHSLGVFALATRVCRRLYEIKDFSIGECQILRVAALTHDVGHYPLSHSTEEAYSNDDEDIANHESMGARIICKTSLADVINDAVGEHGASCQDIAEIIQGRATKSVEKPAVWQLINSQFDLDRMDYLMRDGSAVGLDYGRIDFSRILTKIVVDPTTKNLGVDIKARAAVENYILARYYLWDTVYQHKAVQGFEIIQSEATRILIKEGLLPNFNELIEMNEEEYCEFDDNCFWRMLFGGMQKNEKLSIIGKMLRDREPLKLAYEAPPLQDPILFNLSELRSKATPYIDDEEYIANVLKDLDIPQEWYYPKKVALSIQKFLPHIEDEPYDPEYSKRKEEAKANRAKTIRLFKIDKDNNKKYAGFLANHPHSVISNLQGFEKASIRFYTRSLYETKLRQYFEKKFEKKE